MTGSRPGEIKMLYGSVRCLSIRISLKGLGASADELIRPDEVMGIAGEKTVMVPLLLADVSRQFPDGFP